MSHAHYGKEYMDAAIVDSVIGSGAVDIRAASAGVNVNRGAILWKADEYTRVPPFALGLLGMAPNLQFNILPESKTWTCVPEPLVLMVNWDAGGSDEWFRFANQAFSLVRYTDPNTGITTANATYSAQLIASGRAKTTILTATPGVLSFDVTLRDASGGVLHRFGSQPIWTDCHTNQVWVHGTNFNPGLYDLVAGAKWQIVGSQRADRCR